MYCNILPPFTHHCEESRVIEDFKFLIEENQPPPDFDMSDQKEKAAWISDSHRFTYGNILIDSSQASLEKVQQAWDEIHSALKKFSSAPDPVKMPQASQKLVSFQNRKWLYKCLRNSWTPNMKTIMLCLELHF
jgi:hypothetical protein